MCGISGIISREALSEDYKRSVLRMNDALVHRGPDSQGFFTDVNLALAHSRLSIIDLETGNQPLYNNDRSLALIVNGEIYNFIELREELKAKGCVFSTNSDCEVILHLYSLYGIECLRYLRGMFVFALWDKKLRRLFLARDRMGEKPLYIFEGDRHVIFSSEVKSLLKSGLVPFTLDPVAVNEYFHYQYVPEPKTPIKGVRKIPPAHYITIDVDNWHLVQKEYWALREAEPLSGDPSQLIQQELNRIGELIIRSDVPVGVALSSGLDSSAIAALAARKSRGNIHAFSVGYPGYPSCDERVEAKAFADELNMPFHEVELGTEEMVNFFPELVYWRDDPIADISGFCYYSLMRAARENNVPVLLQGQGADELFWGYPWLPKAVEESIQKSQYSRISSFFKSFISEIKVPDMSSPKAFAYWCLSFGGLRTGWERYLRTTSLPKERLVFFDLSPNYRLAGKKVKNFYSTKFIEEIHSADPALLFHMNIPWKNIDVEITRLICQTYLLQNGIAQADRLGMASSIETRLPFVDYKLVETVIGLRKTYSDYNLLPKAWLKSALKDIIPEWVLSRPKRGFSPPLRQWHRRLFKRYGSNLRRGYLYEAGILSDQGTKHLSKGTLPLGIVSPISFKALVLEEWCRAMRSISLN